MFSFGGSEGGGEEEVGDEAHGFRGEGFLDLDVLVGRARRAVLEEVVEVGEQAGLGLWAQLLDALEVGGGEDLTVAGPAEGQEGAMDLGEVAGGVEGEEGLHPGEVELLLEVVGGAAAEADAVLLFLGEGGGVAEDDGLELVAGWQPASHLQAGNLRPKDFAHAGHADGHEAVAQPLGAEDGLVLLEHDVESRAALSGEHDDVFHVFVPCRHHGRYGGALAVTAEAEAAGVDGGVAFQDVEERFGVFGEGEGGGGVEGAPGGADAAVVVAEGGDAAGGQVVGQDEEGTMVEELLVAVLLAAAGDEHQAGVGGGRVAEGQREGALEVDAVAVGVDVVDGEGLLGEAVLRCLGSAELVEGVGGEEGDGFAQEALAPGALPTPLSFARQGALQRHSEADRGALEAEGVAGERPFCDGDGFRGLQGAVELVGAVGLVEAEGQGGLLAPAGPPLGVSAIED